MHNHLNYWNQEVHKLYYYYYDVQKILFVKIII